MTSPLHALDAFLRRLDESKIHYRLNRVRGGYVMVEIAVPGERWEVEFDTGGGIEVEVFRGDGQIHGPEALDRLFREFGDAS